MSERKRSRGVVSPIGEDTYDRRPQSCYTKPKCIPRQVCKPKVQCRERPVQVARCEELPKETVIEPIEEDIVKITQTELPYCEYRKYCEPVKKVPYCEEPVTIEPPKVVTPKVIKCGLLSTCCWEGLNLLPKSFWLNKNFESGRDYITIGNDGKYLSSDEEGNITIKTSGGAGGVSELFRVTKVATGIVHIMSYYGGYLTIKEDGSVDAITRTICDDNFIHIIYSKNNCSKDEINYIALRAINGNYLTIENVAVSVDKLTASALFSGYLFDAKDSKCYGQEPEVEEVEEEEEEEVPEVEDEDDDEITTITPTLPRKCLGLTDKIISIKCKVIMEKIKKSADRALTRGRRRRYRH